MGLIYFFGSLLTLLGGVVFVFYLRVRSKGEQQAAWWATLRTKLQEQGAEFLEPNIFHYQGSVYQLQVHLAPLFRRNVSLRLSMFVDSFYEFELSYARNVPSAKSQRLAQDAFYRHFMVSGMVQGELEEYLLAPEVKETLHDILPYRWKAFSKMFIELVLFSNAFDYREYTVEELLKDLAVLRCLASRPLRRRLSGAKVTFRTGFEADVPEWHWKREEVKALTKRGVTRVVVSCYADNPLLNGFLVELFFALSSERARLFLTDPRKNFEGLSYAFGERTFRLQAPLFLSEQEDVLVAADHLTDGAFFHGFIAAEASAQAKAHALFQAEPLARWHAIAVAHLGEVDFYARRLLDDEASWFSGEYEILSQRLDVATIEGAVRRIAEEYNAVVKTIHRRFQQKWLFEEGPLTE